jgi:hypothetical protein
VLNIVRVRTDEVRFFITELSMATLTPDQRRIVKCFAKDVIGSPAPVRLDFGHDSNKELAYQILAQKTKSMRRQAKKEHNRS